MNNLVGTSVSLTNHDFIDLFKKAVVIFNEYRQSEQNTVHDILAYRAALKAGLMHKNPPQVMLGYKILIYSEADDDLKPYIISEALRIYNNP